MAKIGLGKRTEHIVDRLIPYCLILLLFIIVMEMFFYETAQKITLLIESLDYFVIAVFLFDLYFKFQRVRSVPKFLRKYWLDIIAVFPVFLFVRLIEEFSAVERVGRLSQSAIHEIEILEKEGIKITEEAAKGARISRVQIAGRFIRPIARMPRLAKALRFFEHPSYNRRR